MAVNIETGLYPGIHNSEDYIAHLTPWQIEIFTQRAMGLTRSQIGEKFGRSRHTIRNIVSYCMDTETTNVTEIIYSLIKTEKIDKTKLSEGLDFEKYSLLSDGDREVVEVVTKREHWGDTREEMAYQLNHAHTSFKKQLVGIYKKLAVNNMLRLRVFMFLKAERETGLQDLPQTADVLPTAAPRVIKIDDLRAWGLKSYQEIHARRRSLNYRVG